MGMVPSANETNKPAARRGRRGAWFLLFVCCAMGLGAVYLRRESIALWWQVRNLSAEHPDDRKAAARELISVAGREMSLELKNAFRKETIADTRIEMLLALVRRGSRDLESIVRDIQRGDLDLDTQSIYSIGRLEASGAGAIPLLSHFIHYGAPERRRAAVHTAGRLGAAGIPLLFEALEKTACHGPEHQDAVRALGDNPAQGLRGLVERRARRRGTCRMLEGVLLANSKVAMAILVDVLTTGDDRERDVALDMLADLGTRSKAAIPVLLASLSNPSSETRRLAVRAIGKTRASDLVGLKTLAGMVRDDESSAVREAAVRAIGRMKPSDAVLVGVVGDALEDQVHAVRFCAAQALGRIGTPAVVVIDSMRHGLRGGVTTVREELAKALRRIGPAAREAVPELIAMVELPADDPAVDELRELAIEALGAIGSTKALPALRMAVRDKDSGVRKRAIHALSSNQWESEG